MNQWVTFTGVPKIRQDDYKMFGPRFGFAYRVHPSVVVRGSFGIFYDLIQPVNYYTWPQSNVPFFPQMSLSTPGFPDAFTSITDISRIIPGVWVTTEPTQSYVSQYNLTLQHEVLPRMVVTVGYQGCLTGGPGSGTAGLSGPLGSNLLFLLPCRGDGQLRHFATSQDHQFCWSADRLFA